MTNRYSGFTLIEVLIAMLVLALGLLGFAALQAVSLSNNQSAYYRSQATQLAYDMADRIRANPVDAKNFATSAYVTSTNPVLQTSCGSSPGCLPAVMAQNDRAQWLANIKTTLPKGTGNIVVVAVTRVFTITISWDDSKSGTQDTDFAMSFQL